MNSRMANLRFLRIVHYELLIECRGVGELYALEKLVISQCRRIEELPFLGQLINLRDLDISYCKSLKEVLGLSELVALEFFWAWGCLKLAALPDMVNLTKLQELDIWLCPMREVSGLDGLLGLTTLRASFGKILGKQFVLTKLSALKVVVICEWDGPIWTAIQSLLMLEDLSLRNCNGDDVGIDLRNLERLKKVALFRCEYKDLMGLSNLTALETLWLDGCDKLERLHKFERLPNLTNLSVTGCTNLRDFPRGGTMSSLESLEVDEFSRMRVVRDLETLTRLRKLALWGSGCENVLGMTSLPSQLETLKITCCLTMEVLDMSNFLELEELKLDRCRALERVTCSNSLTALTKLKVIECESLVEMPDLSTFPQLEKLQLKQCRTVRLSCSGRLAAVRNIEILGCDEVEMLESSWFPNLR